jgi:hypothetical protein
MPGRKGFSFQGILDFHRLGLSGYPITRPADGCSEASFFVDVSTEFWGVGFHDRGRVDRLPEAGREVDRARWRAGLPSGIVRRVE